MTLAAKAYAKINPYLAVGRLREDGYHDIDTIFQAVELHDIVTIAPADNTRVVCSIEELNNENNLASKALRLCAEVFEFPSLEIRIEKNIPVQAGLGGGSSDAAATLRLLNRLSGGALTRDLASIALACGSDVPFFLGSSTRARAKGRGELLEPMEPLPPTPLVLAMPPGVYCSTAKAFAMLDASPPKGGAQNDFERVAPAESVELIARMNALGADTVGLCGSGSAVYGFLSDAGCAAKELEESGFWAVATSTITSFGDSWTL